MINATDLHRFVHHCIGLQLPFLDAPFLARNKRRMPGNPDMIAKRVTARPFEERPGDPFLTDGMYDESLTSYFRTYSRHYAVTVEYSTDDQEPNIERMQKSYPETFTTASHTVGGEFLKIKNSGINSWASVNLKETADETRTLPAGSGFNFIIDDFLAGAPIGGNRVISEKLTDPRNVIQVPWGYVADNTFGDITAADTILTPRVTDANLDFPRVMSLREWTVRWRHVFRIPWMTINRLLGKVNEFKTVIDVPVNIVRPEAPIYPPVNRIFGYLTDPTGPLFSHAPGETVLFTGATVTEESLKGWDGRRLWTVDYHFVEKTIWEPYSQSTEYYAIMGWNHFWNATAFENAGAFQRLVVNLNTGAGPYQAADLSKLFEFEGPDRNPHPGVGDQMEVKLNRDRAERGRRPGSTTS